MHSPEDNNLKSFALFLQNVENGALHDDLSEKLHEVLQEIADAAISRGGKQKASITLKLDFALDDNLVVVVPDIKTKTPAAPRGRSMFFVTPDGHLSRQDPRQRSFDEVLERREKTHQNA